MSLTRPLKDETGCFKQPERDRHLAHCLKLKPKFKVGLTKIKFSAISIWSENFVYAFVTNGVQHGKDGGTTNNVIVLQINEKVTSIRYSNHAEDALKYNICGLSLITNQRTLGPYINHAQCGQTKFTVDVPDDQNFENFISTAIILADDHSVLGFKNHEILRLVF